MGLKPTWRPARDPFNRVACGWPPTTAWYIAVVLLLVAPLTARAEPGVNSIASRYRPEELAQIRALGPCVYGRLSDLEVGEMRKAEEAGSGSPIATWFWGPPPLQRPRIRGLFDQCDPNLAAHLVDGVSAALTFADRETARAILADAGISDGDVRAAVQMASPGARSALRHVAEVHFRRETPQSRAPTKIVYHNAELLEILRRSKPQLGTPEVSNSKLVQVIDDYILWNAVVDYVQGAE